MNGSKLTDDTLQDDDELAVDDESAEQKVRQLYFMLNTSWMAIVAQYEGCFRAKKTLRKIMHWQCCSTGRLLTVTTSPCSELSVYLKTLVTCSLLQWTEHCPLKLTLICLIDIFYNLKNAPQLINPIQHFVISQIMHVHGSWMIYLFKVLELRCKITRMKDAYKLVSKARIKDYATWR